MAIEIRPAAVRSQLSERGRRLDAIAGAVQSAYDRVDRFCGSGNVLGGAGYEAARVHMGQYKNYCMKVAECVEMTREADGKVASALGSRFGAMSVVSEREWLDKKNSAQRQASHYRSEASRMAAQPLSPESAFGAMCARFSASRWDRQAEYASRKLSDIYSYCAETNGLYEGDLGKLTDAVRAGASAFASCRFDASANRWEPIDYSWTNDEIEAIAANNMGKLLLKGYADVDRALIADPIVNPIVDWWEEDGEEAKYAKELIFGTLGIAFAGVAIITGGGFIAVGLGIVSLVASTPDWWEGLNYFISGEKGNWKRDMANALPGDSESNYDIIESVSLFASFCSAPRALPAAGRLVESKKAFSFWAKEGNAEKIANSGFAAAGRNNSSRAYESSKAAGSAMVESAEDLSDSLGAASDLTENVLDKAVEARKKREAADAGA